ncbi:hypothetical protein [Actinophytocola sp.]|uniref:hypothetical protein n=1 Tax=Actinophytocola sp. TaxID=1872138 RepID=UPI003D6B2F5A
MDPRATVLVLVLGGAALLALSLCLPAGTVVAARVAIDWLVVAVPAVLAALGRPVTRA